MEKWDIDNHHSINRRIAWVERFMPEVALPPKLLDAIPHPSAVIEVDSHRFSFTKLIDDLRHETRAAQRRINELETAIRTLRTVV